jgi:hypothetical protein
MMWKEGKINYQQFRIHIHVELFFSSHITFKALILMEQKVISPLSSIFHSQTGIYEFEIHIFLAVYPYSR